VGRKNQKIASLIHSLAGSRFDPHYLGFFECFNQQRFFEAHEVLEELWLRQRGTPKDLFYKSLIQLAGAFVHIQKGRCRPAISLLRLACGYLAEYPRTYESLDIGNLQGLIGSWIEALERDNHPWSATEGSHWPRLSLEIQSQ
jgi:predicted metal-dependent hydrolase